MKFIEIKTTQNVVLQYELADLRDRILAFLIDLTCVVFTIGLLSSISSGVSQTPLVSFMFSFLLISIFVFYSLLFELLNNGQSLGKIAMGIRVIKATSGRPSVADYAARWVFRLVDVYLSLGGIASVMIASSAKSQRIGDIVANTAVVKLSSRMNLVLDDILTIHSQATYKPEYVQAKQLAEDDVILIKNTLDRYRKFGNEAHEEAIALLSKKIAAILHLGQGVQHDHQRFLETILRDYVMLTR